MTFPGLPWPRRLPARSPLWPLAWRALLLGAAAAALAAQIAAKAPLPQATAPAGDVAATLVIPAGPGERLAVAYPDVTAHPLFDPTRLPWSPPPPPPPPPIEPVVLAPAPPLQPPRDYVLAGIILSAGQHRALLRAGTGRILQVTEGQAVEGWTVTSIDRGRLRLSLGEASYELAFPGLKGSAGTPRPTP